MLQSIQVAHDTLVSCCVNTHHSVHVALFVSFKWPWKGLHNRNHPCGFHKANGFILHPRVFITKKKKISNNYSLILNIQQHDTKTGRCVFHKEKSNLDTHTHQGPFPSSLELKFSLSLSIHLAIIIAGASGSLVKGDGHSEPLLSEKVHTCLVICTIKRSQVPEMRVTDEPVQFNWASLFSDGNLIRNTLA